MVLLVLPLAGEAADSASVWVIALPWDLSELFHIHLAKGLVMHESSNLMNKYRAACPDAKDRYWQSCLAWHLICAHITALT